ncbi:MAG: ARMT1-like domain-containing protein [Planctomycetes bacterium]|nr:ARMT1-like domain-containing protein [Planctomycetota bacterium]
MNRILETAAQVTQDPWLHKKVMLDVAAAVVSGEIDFDRSPAEVTSEGVLRACAILNADPFLEGRRKMNAGMLAHLPALTASLQALPDPLIAAGRLAAVCNDPGLFERPIDPAALVSEAASRKFAVDNFEALKTALGPAKRVMYVLDNAGEIVADRIFIDAIGPRRVTAVVSRKPLMRDALESDAEQAGLACRVIHTGCDLAGAPPAAISLEFRREMDRADVIIAKGQSAFQTMEEGPWKAFYLMVARCACTAKHLQVPQGSTVCLAKDAATNRVTRRVAKGA